MTAKIRNKVLIIEDDPGIRMFLKTTVTADGYEALTSSDDGT